MPTLATTGPAGELNTFFLFVVSDDFVRLAATSGLPRAPNKRKIDLNGECFRVMMLCADCFGRTERSPHWPFAAHQHDPELAVPTGRR